MVPIHRTATEVARNFSDYNNRVLMASNGRHDVQRPRPAQAASQARDFRPIPMPACRLDQGEQIRPVTTPYYHLDTGSTS
jgi:hypothetical protein